MLSQCARLLAWLRDSYAQYRMRCAILRNHLNTPLSRSMREGLCINYLSVTQNLIGLSSSAIALLFLVSVLFIYILLYFRSTEKFTAIFLAFIIDEEKSIYDYDVLSECVASKLSSLPYHTKIVVGAPRRIIIDDFPEMLSIGSPGKPISPSIFNSMIEVFIKRYHKVDLVSMMRELLRTRPEIVFKLDMDDNLSTLPSFEKRKEQELERHLSYVD